MEKKFFRAEGLRLRLKAIALACCQEPWVPAPGPAQVLLPFKGLKPTQELPLLGNWVLRSVGGSHGTTFDNKPAQ